MQWKRSPAVSQKRYKGWRGAKTYAKLDHPEPPSLERMGCAFSIVLIPNKTDGHARYLKSSERSFEKITQLCCQSTFTDTYQANCTHRLRVTIIRPDKNIPEVERPSKRHKNPSQSPRNAKTMRRRKLKQQASHGKAMAKLWSWTNLMSPGTKFWGWYRVPLARYREGHEGRL